FIGDEIAGLRKPCKRLFVIIGGNDLAIGHLCGGTVGLRLEDHGAKIQPGGRHRQHAAKLATADNADRSHAWSTGYSATVAVCCSRQSSSLSARSGSLSARTAAASKAALTAPARPIASVPT